MLNKGRVEKGRDEKARRGAAIKMGKLKNKMAVTMQPRAVSPTKKNALDGVPL